MHLLIYPWDEGSLSRTAVRPSVLEPLIRFVAVGVSLHDEAIPHVRRLNS